jgi:hypothetical protein
MADKRFDVSWLAKQLDLQPASIRVALRDLGVKKNKETNKYEWASKDDAEKVAKKLRERGERQGAPAGGKKAAKKAPAKKTKKKLTLKKKHSKSKSVDRSNDD